MTAAAHVIAARTVPLAALHLEHSKWTNPREFSGLDEDELETLAKSIKDKGIGDPIKVQKVSQNGGSIDLVIDGQRRVLAARKVLPKTAQIPVVDLNEDPIELTEEEADKLTIRALSTLEREGLSSYELSTVAERMKARGKTGSFIAKAINKSESWISKILKARATASAKLRLQWQKGEITDEQFKELAELKDPSKQEAAAKEVVAARKEGDKSEARVRAKELKEAERAESKKNHKNGHDPVVKGPQVEMWKAPPPVKKSPPMTGRVILEEFVELADKRPPTADYVKGLMDGVRYALGTLQPNKFAKPWKAYIARIDGSGKAKPKAKKTIKRKSK